MYWLITYHAYSWYHCFHNSHNDDRNRPQNIQQSYNPPFGSSLGDKTARLPADVIIRYTTVQNMWQGQRSTHSAADQVVTHIAAQVSVLLVEFGVLS